MDLSNTELWNSNRRVNMGIQRTALSTKENSSEVSAACCCPDWLEQSLTPHSTQYRSFRRRSSQPITWLILTNKTVQENTDKQTLYKSEKVDNLKYSKTKLPLFSCLLQRSARKPGGLILQRPRAHTGAVAQKILWSLECGSSRYVNQSIYLSWIFRAVQVIKSFQDHWGCRII